MPQLLELSQPTHCLHRLWLMTELRFRKRKQCGPKRMAKDLYRIFSRLRSLQPPVTTPTRGLSLLTSATGRRSRAALSHTCGDPQDQGWPSHFQSRKQGAAVRHSADFTNGLLVTSTYYLLSPRGNGSRVALLCPDLSQVPRAVPVWPLVLAE